MNEMVLKQHSLFRAKVKSEKSLKAAVKRKRGNDGDLPGGGNEFEFTLDQIRFRKTYCQEVDEIFSAVSAKKAKGDRHDDDLDSKEAKFSSSPPQTRAKAKKRAETDPHASTSSSTAGIGFSPLPIPDEIVMNILSRLGPRDLLRTAQASKKLHALAFTPSLWRRILPTQWAKGNWSFDPEPQEEKKSAGAGDSALASLASSTDSLNSCVSSSDSSVDENTNAQKASSQSGHFFNSYVRTSDREGRIFKGIVRHLLPRVGSGVSELVATKSRGITDVHLRGMMSRCPGLVRVDLTGTPVGQHAFKGVLLANLVELNLSDCKFVTDATLESIGAGYYRRKRGVSYPSK